ncbi:MAG: hypothetical protein PHQ35_01295 [Phycisphaerae bacterium]|nr:hypothetical protein [Phycisphaerae bacterium]MDD5381739.1 hypothetical protein [Phycisphaerae bacterium]
MKLLKVVIPKSKLSSVPENERVFFVLTGSLLNDLNMLQKLMIFSSNVKTANQVAHMAQNIQTLSLIRIQAGKLHEGWKLLQKNFFGTKLSFAYEKELTDPEKESLEKLKTYFRKDKNLISSIRNKFAFHYYPSSTEINQLIDDLRESEIFEIFMSEFYGNCVFSMSNVLINYLILEHTGVENTDENTNKAMIKLLHDITDVTSWFGSFLGGCLLVFAKKHLGLESTEVEIPEPPDINEVTLPYFIKGERN